MFNRKFRLLGENIFELLFNVSIYSIEENHLIVLIFNFLYTSTEHIPIESKLVAKTLKITKNPWLSREKLHGLSG